MTGTVSKGPINRADMALYDGINDSSSRTDSTGGTTTGLAVNDFVDVLQVFGGGTARTGATVQAAIDALGTRVRGISLATGPWIFDDDLTIPSNLTLVLWAGATLEPVTTKTVTIAGVLFRMSGTYTGGLGTVTVTGQDLLATADTTAIYAVESGSADLYVITPDPSIASYEAGQTFRFLVTNVNTGAATLNVSALGAKDLVKNVDDPLVAGDLPAGKLISVVYDGTNFQLVDDPSLIVWDLNGEALILDVDGDTTLRAATDDQVDLQVGGTTVLTVTTGMQVGQPTGGDKGAGAVNAKAYYAEGYLQAGWYLLDSQTPSAAADVTFTTAAWFASPWVALRLEFDGIYPATSSANAWLRLSIDGGSTWLSASTSYMTVDLGVSGDGLYFDNGGQSGGSPPPPDSDRIGLWGDAVNTAASGGASAEATITGFAASAPTMVRANAVWARVTNNMSANNVWAHSVGTTAVDGIQFLFSTGNIGGGTIRLYGMLGTALT